MFFDNYQQHTDAQVRSSLFWEYDLSRFDWEKMRTLIVQHIKNIPTLNSKDMSFVCAVFGLKKEDLKCYMLKQSRLLVYGKFFSV